MRTYLLEEMTWTEIQEAMDKGMKTVIIYAASVEQHGPHLAEITDTVLGQHAAVDLAKRLGGALVAPVIRPGLSAHHLCFPGSITLRPEIFKGLVEDYIASYVHHGFNTIILASSHGGNFKMMEEIAGQQAEKYPGVRIVCGCSLEELDEALVELEEIEDLPRGTCGGHACDWETSVMRMINEDYVHMEQARPGFVGVVSDDVLKTFFEEGVSAVSKIGVMGDPTVAEAEKGARYFQYTQDLQEKAVRRHLAQWEENAAKKASYVLRETDDYYPLSVLFDALDLHIEISRTAPSGTVKMWRIDDAATGSLLAAATLQIRDGVYVLGQLGVDKEHQRKGYGKILQNALFAEAKKRGIEELWCTAKVPEYYYPLGWEKMDWDTSPNVARGCDTCESRGNGCPAQKLRKRM